METMPPLKSHEAVGSGPNDNIPICLDQAAIRPLQSGIDIEQR